MKKITLFTAFALLGTSLTAQNVWNGSTVSTTSTNGELLIGTSTSNPTYLGTFLNSNNTKANGWNNAVSNTYAGSQNAFNNTGYFLGTTGEKIGFSQWLASSSTAASYGINVLVLGLNPGPRYGISSKVDEGTVRCGLYSRATAVTTTRIVGALPNAHRSAFLIGTVEIIPNNATDKAFIINRRELGVSGTGTDVFRIYGDGKVYATEVNVMLSSNFPDYVFLPTYHLMPLTEVRNYIRDNGHLPNVPSAETVAEEGVNLGATTAVLVEKIEELTLYLLQQQTEIEAMKLEIEALKAN